MSSSLALVWLLTQSVAPAWAQNEHPEHPAGPAAAPSTPGQGPQAPAGEPTAGASEPRSGPDQGPGSRPRDMEHDPSRGPWPSNKGQGAEPDRPGRPSGDELAPGAGPEDGAGPYRQPRQRPPEEQAFEAPPPERPRGPMSANDARVNLPTVVETYVREHSPRGHMPVRDKKGKLWKLILERIDEDSLRPAGPDRYRACAKMRTAPDGPDHRLDIDFTVDFSGALWKVASVDIHTVSGVRKTPKASRKRSPKKAS